MLVLQRKVHEIFSGVSPWERVLCARRVSAPQTGDSSRPERASGRSEWHRKKQLCAV